MYATRSYDLVQNTVASTAGMTTEELAARSPVALGRRPENMAALMRESERAGIVEQVGEVWRLTDDARRQHGAALAQLGNE